MQQTMLDQAQQLLSLTAAVAALFGQGALAQKAPDVSKKEKKRIAAEAAAAAALAVNAPTAANGPNAIKPAITPAPAPALVLANPSAFDYKYDGPAWKDVLMHNRPRMLEGKKLQWPQPPDFNSVWVDIKGSDIVCLKCNSSTGGHHNTLACTNPQSADAYIQKNISNTVG